jgi:hypothetical protein
MSTEQSPSIHLGTADYWRFLSEIKSGPIVTGSARRAKKTPGYPEPGEDGPISATSRTD